MPVYHFVFHSYGSWLPDREEGYFKHGEGWKVPSNRVSEQYRNNMQGQPVQFFEEQQQMLIDESVNAQSFQRFTLYAAAADATHIHAVVAWTDERDATAIRTQLKSSLTRTLNTRYRKTQWFVAKAGEHPVRDQDHLSFLVHDYLPKHRLYWYYKS